MNWSTDFRRSIPAVPWTRNADLDLPEDQRRQLELFGFIEMMVFLIILLVGYVYAWRRGALEWA